MGNEANLLSCSHSGIGIHTCTHREDAGVNCTGMIEIQVLYMIEVDAAVIFMVNQVQSR